ncbi:tRNA (adenosine(37)-N6)-dimethylallyltransferase MiaA [Patescibacteria group bacterium]|nr:tRNA (adenosine(37)-N6)-dimethylallyltransferase MiaA [Patescibacteria group bacterium]MBU0776830.1 tRNA (adenosine(37)-N6)-dimethylallyltransferase MiaA [Patescibacteria group bacterium]MBU0845595.1 tRNA (adenosine(37)-N6)-dimethylallyltransferase MiaA [Patescibacteria group bacterium]MBU0922637.1 tRNA (adenosine(37)-N6)-dimethylallyltransferase MiaA [Patescibacteria group bacterium]MBU1066688.1 tRNA (adenosine(37)-N6)-dimethylallyltransferase MiaA [Patescibacteria group bacterium]
MNKLLVICGPTATGKTKLALHLAKELTSDKKGLGLKGELVSADSRQIYKGLDIGTGKDIPKNAKFIVPRGKRGLKLGGYYQVGQAKIWGYDLTGPKQEFSVAQYVKIADEIIKDIWSRNKIPILVGGTGLYIKAIVDGIPTISISKNIRLRKSLEKKKRAELFEILARIGPMKAAAMNYSDKRNPRRLVRAIEVAQWELKNKLKEDDSRKRFSTLIIGLKIEKRVLVERINKRVKARVEMGLEKEIERLFKQGVTWKHQSMESLGYKQWKDYFEKYSSLKMTIPERKIDREKVMKKWEKEEGRYSKKQMTWFRRDKRIKWFDIASPGWQKNVVKLAKEWYKSEGALNSDAKKN